MDKSKEKKVVFLDGNLQDGKTRCIRGQIIKETDSTITIRRSNGTIEIGKTFLIKIENWI